MPAVLRDLALRILERASSEGRFAPPPGTERPDSVAQGLETVLDGLSDADYRWLGTVDFPALTTPMQGRVSAGTVLMILYRLGDFARARQAGDGPQNGAAARDLRRLRALENGWFGG